MAFQRQNCARRELSRLAGWSRFAKQGRRLRLMLLLAFALGSAGLKAGDHSLDAEITRQLQKNYKAPPEQAPTFLETISLLALVAGAGFTFFKLAPLIKERMDARLDPWAKTNKRASELSANEMAEQQEFSEFATALQIGPATVRPVMDNFDSGPPAETANGAPVETGPNLLEFFDKGPQKLGLLRSLSSQVTKPSNEKVRPQILADLFREARSFKGAAELPELLPAWQLASALAGLLKQLTEKPATVTASTLSTVSGAVALLESLSVKDLRPDLATNPAAGLLVVDDDPISRTAVSSSLKKVFNPPDIAANGEEALKLAEKRSYDAIFVDVEMPGMDGFELCKKIRETAPNGRTPVVFVTSHSDFESRAKSARSGGQDLIAKPFLSFEIAVKALTLILGSRLGQQFSAAVPSVAQTSAVAPSPPPSPAQVSEPNVAAAPGSPITDAEDPLRASADDFARAFFDCAPAHIETIRTQLKALVYANDDASRQEYLAELYVSAHDVTAEAERAELRAAGRLCSTLQSLLKKMMDNCRNVTTSTMAAVDGALDSLDRLCAARINPDLADPEIQILVVDDDPIARRTVSSAIQLAFSKPDAADNGEEAVGAAEQKAYDVIFLDVEMPGMDGFSACSKIHKTALNAGTPVVFVTSHSDMESRAKAGLAGGCDLVPKPALAVELTLRALTFAIRCRLGRRLRIEPIKESAVPVCV